MGKHTNHKKSFFKSKANCMSIQNLGSKDPFADDEFDDEAVGSGASQSDYVHIRIQQRNGRKSLTTIAGLPEKIDTKKVLKAFKKEFCCNGCIVETGGGDEEEEDSTTKSKVIQLQGDQRQNAKDFMVKAKLLKENVIKIHGY